MLNQKSLNPCKPFRNIQVYNGGDMLYKGSQMLRESENEDIRNLGFKVYSPKDDKEINDKKNQTAEDNDCLADKIIKKDTAGMVESDVLIFDYQRFAEGTIAEIGQTFGMMHFANSVKKMIHNLRDFGCSPEMILVTVLAHCNHILDKKVFFHCEDIRRTDIPETGDSRSFYINQYVHGLVRALGGGFKEWDEILLELNGLEDKESEEEL